MLADASNNFYGPVYAAESRFGLSADTPGAPQARARDGRLTDQDIAAALDRYVRPEPFRDAADALAKDGVVVLAGPPGIGKAAGAIALLREVTSGPLALLSPTVSLRQLAGRDFTAVPGFVVMDWQYDRSGPDATDFTWRMLREQLHDAGAHLVITTTATPRSGGPGLVGHFTWEQPPIGEVLCAYLAGTSARSPDRRRRGPGSGQVPDRPGRGARPAPRGRRGSRHRPR